MDHLKIGIIVPFYNGHSYLDRLAESVDKASAGLDCTLFIVDNSPAGPPVLIPDHVKTPVEVIRERPGIGYGKACNAGFQRCRNEEFDYIIIVNQDGYLSTGMIRALLIPFGNDESIMMTAPLLKTYSGEEVESFFIKYYLSQAPALFSDLLSGKAADYYSIQRISGACFAFRLNTKRYPYGYFFDPLFHMYYEDEELCQRIHMADGKIMLVCKDAVFYHQHSNTSDTDNRSDITAAQLVSEKILRLKDPSRSSFRTLSGIFATTFSSMLDQLLRGRIRPCYWHFRSLAIIIVWWPRIIRTRRQDITASSKAL